MAYWQEQAIGVGHDNPALTNFEDWFAMPFDAQRVGLGGSVTRASDGYEVTDGWREVVFQQAWNFFDRLDAYVLAIFGDWETETVEVTLKVRKRDNAFGTYNALAYLPRDGSDYEHVTTQQLQNIRLRFLILEPAAV